MKIIQNAAKVPEPPRPPKVHSCEEELRRAEMDSDLSRRFGLIVQCSCGRRYQLRPTSAIRYFVGVKMFGHQESRYFVLQYWHSV